MTSLCLSIQPRHALAPAFDSAMQQAGFKTYLASSWPSALRALSQWIFDVVLLEPVGVPGDRADTMARLRDLRVPVVTVSGSDEARPFFWPGQSGAAPRPALPSELAARLREVAEARFDRSAGGRPARVLGALRMEPRSARASYGGRDLELTQCEFELLLMLVDGAGEFVDREALASALRLRSAKGRRSTDMHICRIRKKLREQGAEAVRIRTVHGHGYCATVEAAEEAAAAEGGRAALAAAWPRPSMPARATAG